MLFLVEENSGTNAMSFRRLRKVAYGSVGQSRLFRHLRNSSKLIFPVINGHVDTQSPDFKKKKESFSKCCEKYMEYTSRLDSGISEKAVKRHVEINKKLLVKERLSQILDPGSDFLEVSPLAGIGLEYGDVIRGGMFCGIGWISGQPAVVQANDATVKGGTAYPITVTKQLRAQEIAEENNLPCLYLIDSGGAFLPLQVRHTILK